MNEQLEKNRTLVAILAGGFILLLGAYIRLAPVLANDFPVNDGGLFSTIVDAQAAAGWRVPEYISFNGYQIPFAYPPFGFCLAAIILRITGMETIQLMRFLPAVTSIFSVAAFFLLARTVLGRSNAVYMAPLIFALVPRSWQWLIMGGGLTRSFGLLFLILAVNFAYRLYHYGTKANLLLTIIFASLTIMSHPETGVFAVLTIILLFLVFNRTWPGFLHLSIIGVGTLVGTIPWWLTVILRYGPQPLLAASGTSGLSLMFLKDILFLNAADEVKTSFVSALFLIGLMVLISRKSYFFPLWSLIILVFFQRSGLTFIMVPLSLVTGYLLVDFFPLFLPRLSESDLPDQPKKTPRLAGALIGYVFATLMLSALWQPYLEDSFITSLTPDDLEVMVWVADHTPEDSDFLVITDQRIWDDKVSEWFPYLTRRQSLSTVQGTEWLPEGRYLEVKGIYLALRHCLDGSPGCVESVADDYDLAYDYVYVPRQTIANVSQRTEALILSLEIDPAYQVVYTGDGAVIFEFLDK